MSESFVVKRRFVVVDTVGVKVVATFTNEQAAIEHARRLNAMRRKK